MAVGGDLYHHHHHHQLQGQQGGSLGRIRMGGLHCGHRKTWINLLLGLLQLLLPWSKVQHGTAQLQALSQISSGVVEVWQAEDTDTLVPVQMEEERRKDGLPLEERSSPYARETGRPLHFQPPMLDFGTQPVGVPRAETIYIHNPSQEEPVTLLSMFTSSTHFHMPAFHRRVIPPRGKASFKLIFLPSEEGQVENSLFINTSAHGVMAYQVFGVGGQRGSLKSVQRKDNMLIFPHIHSIKLTQTQEDASNVTILGLVLECSLPKTLFNSPQGSCLQTEEQQLSLQINLSERGDPPTHLDKLKPYVIEHILLLLAVPSAAGPRSAGELKIGVHMLNSGARKLYVKDMSVLSKVDASLDFKQVLLKPEAKNFTQVASLACTGALPGNSGRCSTHISLQILGNHTANTFTHRALGWEVSSVLQVRRKGSDQVDLWLTNPLPVSLTLTNASLSHRAQGLLKVVNFSGAVTVPQGCWRVLSLRVLNKTLPVNLLSTLRLDTSMGTALHLPLHLHSSMDKQGEVLLEVKGQCSRLCPLIMSETGRIQWHRSLLPESPSSSWAVDSKLAAELCSRWHSHKDQLPCRWPRLPAEPDQPLDFGATPLNESKVKMLTLKNPTSSVLSLEIRSLSQYPAQLEALDLLTKWFNISPLSVNISTTEFSLLTSLPVSLDGVQGVKGSGVLRLTLQPWESREVAVMFTPSEHKHTTTILIIRNNLTVFDMVTVRGHGAKELLRVGGKLPGPGASLRFNVPQSTLMECRDGLRTNKPLFAIRKSFKVENAGELPLTVMSMNINGYKCQGFGFEVLQCHPFSLDHNSSSEITIAFTPDFTSSWVIRDLTLVTSRGSSFPFTLNVTLPHHMLPLCAQVVPGPSWEDTFWVFTLIFTCFSLLGVCLMAFHQAQYILTEFSSPGVRINHSNAGLSRDQHPVNNITPNGVSKTKGSCKSYVDSGHTSDKGKGRGSPALANSGSAPRTQSSNKKGSSGSGSGSGTGSGSTSSSSQPQKKHRVSLFYTKYKPGSSAVTAATAAEEEEQRDPAPPLTQDPDVCNNNEPLFPPTPHDKNTTTTATHFNPGFKEDAQIQLQLELEPAEDNMFPMEAPAVFPDNVTVGPGPRPGLLLCSPVTHSLSSPDSVTVGPGPRPGLLLCSPATHSLSSTERYTDSKTDSSQLETRDDVKAPKKKCESPESGGPTAANKGKKNRRKTVEPGVPDHSVVMMSEREKEADWRTGEQRNGNATRSRNRSSKAEPVKPVQNTTVPIKHNAGVCVSRPRRRCPAERGGGVCESGSDSGSSSGSVRASRGSWSSTSSIEGERDHRTTHCTTSARKRDSMQQYNMYPAERDCYQTINANYKTQSVTSLYRKDVCQTPEPPVPCFNPSFAAVTAGLDRNTDLSVQCFPGEMTSWSAPLTSEFRYNTSESPAYIPQPAAPSPYNRFPWSTTTTSSSTSTGNSSHCNTSYSPCEQASYMTGNGDLQSGFTCPDAPSAYSPQASWGDESPPDPPSAWETGPCMGSKPYFSGTRSLSPMSSLFGSIWTPQSEPYQSHAFHHAAADRSAPISPVSPVAPPYSSSSSSVSASCASAASPFGCGGGSSSIIGGGREPLAVAAPSCPQQQKLQYSTFNPFGPHMNLDIWNSSSSSSARSSNSQLSNDSGYCGDV